MIADPVYDDQALVSVDQMALTNVFRVFTESGGGVVIDMHSMPGGSSQGTYNGVFPHPPAFWNEGNEKVRELGLQSLHRMFKWYNSLRESDKNFVEGFTLLNEPAHLLPAKKDVMLEWMGKAIYAYRQVVARRREHKGLRVPRLYVNLIDTSGVRVRNWRLDAKVVRSRRARQWAVLDTHFLSSVGYERLCRRVRVELQRHYATNQRAHARRFGGAVGRAEAHRGHAGRAQLRRRRVVARDAPRQRQRMR